MKFLIFVISITLIATGIYLLTRKKKPHLVLVPPSKDGEKPINSFKATIHPRYTPPTTFIVPPLPPSEPHHNALMIADNHFNEDNHPDNNDGTVVVLNQALRDAMKKHKT